MRWLLAKDLLILRRSRLLVGVLVVYPIAIALLIGLAISRGPGKPKVAIVDQTPPGQTVQVGSQRVPVSRYAEQLFNQVQSVRVPTRAQAVQEIKSGKVLAAVVIPPNIAARLGSGLRQAQLEVLYNGNALEQSLVQSQINAALAQANIGFSEQIQRAAAQAIGALLSGANLGVLGAPNLIGLGQIPPKLHGIIARLPPGADRSALEQIEAFASFASQNLLLAKNVLSTIGQPIQVKSTLIQGRRTPLNTFAVVVAVSVSLMFVCVLLASGGVALEREEHTLARLVRGLVSRGGCSSRRRCWRPAARWSCPSRCSRGSARSWRSTGAASGCGWRRSRSARPASPRSAWRSARSPARCARPRCWPSCCRCRSPSWRSSRAARWAPACTTRSGRSRSCFPSRPRCRRSTRRSTGASPSIGSALAHLAGLTVVFGALARAGLRRSGRSLEPLACSARSPPGTL